MVETFGRVEIQLIGPQKLQTIYYRGRTDQKRVFIFAFRRQPNRGNTLDFFQCFYCYRLNGIEFFIVVNF